MSKNVKRYWRLDWKFTFISGVKCILGQYAEGPVWIYHAIMRLFFKIAEMGPGKYLLFTCWFWIVVSAINKSFMYMQMHKLPLAKWSSFSFLFESYRGTWIVTSQSMKNRSTVRLTRSGMRFRHCSSLISLRIDKQWQTLARSMLLYLLNTFCRYTRSV